MPERSTRNMLLALLAMAVLPFACATPEPQPAPVEAAPPADVAVDGTAQETGNDGEILAAGPGAEEAAEDAAAPSAEPSAVESVPEIESAPEPQPGQAIKDDVAGSVPLANEVTPPATGPEKEAMPETPSAEAAPKKDMAGAAEKPPSPFRAPTPETPAPEATAAEVAPPPQAKPEPAEPVMDLDGLETRLRQTKAIGLFTKLELKSQVNDLLDDVEDYHRSRNNLTLAQLEEHFNLLVMKLLVLLEDDDPQLRRDIARARPALWTTLADPVQFQTLKGP